MRIRSSSLRMCSGTNLLQTFRTKYIYNQTLKCYYSYSVRFFRLTSINLFSTSCSSTWRSCHRFLSIQLFTSATFSVVVRVHWLTFQKICETLLLESFNHLLQSHASQLPAVTHQQMTPKTPSFPKMST